LSAGREGQIVSTAIDVEDVTFSYGETVAVEDVSLSVEEGDFLGLIGPNGSGKTTLLHLMIGLKQPDHGSIKLFGEPELELTFSIDGLINNSLVGISDSAETVLTGELARDPGESVAGGPYAITRGSLTANSNYNMVYSGRHLTIVGAAAEPVPGVRVGQIFFAGVRNNVFYYRPGNFWHISLNPNDADPGFDVMRGTSDLKSRLGDRRNRCDSVTGGGYCETWSFPEQRE
jgi:energy-coupling factor transporter ATP-binding protein EcfA2